MLKMLLAVLLILSSTLAQAHDKWADGSLVPPRVKAQCCGPADAHQLTPNQVHRKGDYYLVDGYNNLIPASSVLPSQDGNYWIFYHDITNTEQSNVYCFFIPMSF